ncbi:MAG: phosphoribosylformylglycinamidine synthase [Clostridiales bacterium]|nr:phosphoribosylformylglycinamidine synthase [Clostridiales bacterium]
MPNRVRRVILEKKAQYNIEARNIYLDLKENLRVGGLDGVRLAYSYDVKGLSQEEFDRVCSIIFRPTHAEVVYHEQLPTDQGDRILAIQYLPGQFDQRAYATAKSIQAITLGDLPLVRTTKIVVIKGQLDENDYNRIINYIVNPVESRLIPMEKPISLEDEYEVPLEVDVIHGFIGASHEGLEKLMDELRLAMDMDDLIFCQKYFRDQEKRDPTITELRMIDTYWSDHCRHTTFLTRLEDVDFEAGFASEKIRTVFDEYKNSREYVYGNEDRDICLMDIATIAMKELKKRGMLEDLDESEEINACSIAITANINGQDEEWLVMFKNETHNHPTEIEPFGGASTCLGGAIRDPLSGRSYVYQAMRITGSGDPRTPIHNTLEGKLPQLKITNGAAAGYSSYGNQIGVPAGQVVEIYDPGYVAKRMELGAVIAAAPRKNVVRDIPQPGDVVILVGGRTGRDGCGGATGSSKAHTEESMELSGAEVQKGNPAEERKILRLFRNPRVSTMIKRCNDFGAGGVSVAIGELAPGLFIDLDLVPQKYLGLDGTEIAISESQERMAVVVDKANEADFIAAAREENLEATSVARVTEEARLRMEWKGNIILDISRGFLDSNGAPKSNPVKVTSPDMKKQPFSGTEDVKENAPYQEKDIEKIWLDMLRDLNICSQRGLIERFDSTVGGGTVLMPLGGKYQLTPTEGMVAKLPVSDGDTTTGTIMTFGYNPEISTWSPFHGAVYAIVEAVAKVTAIGGDYRKVRLSLQEYFERLDRDPQRWGKPFSALLGAYYAQMALMIPAIGGKDSMSGTFNDLSVPPTLVAFGVTAFDIRNTVSPEFKERGTQVVLIPLHKDQWGLPDFDLLERNYVRIHQLILEGRILSAHSVRAGGIAEAISKMAFGNGIGFKIYNGISMDNLFSPDYGSIILEIERGQNLEEIFRGVNYIKLGQTQEEPLITYGSLDIKLTSALEAWEETLEKVFPTKATQQTKERELVSYTRGMNIKADRKIAKPRIFIPIFPGTTSEYDLIKAFEGAGGLVETLVFRDLNPQEIRDSIARIGQSIKRAQILVIPGGLSIGDEPEKTGQLGTAILKAPQIQDAIKEHLEVNDGLILGLGGGFETLLNLNLISDSPIDLVLNPTGFHVSRIVDTQVISDLSPWFMDARVGDVYTTIVSHREGQLVADTGTLRELEDGGQVATRFVPTGDSPISGIEGLTSKDGRVLGRLGYSERFTQNMGVNVPDLNVYDIFKAGVSYYR